MKERLKVLFITFIDFDSPGESGSAVRPKRMYDAFRKSNCEVMLISGITNNRTKRKIAVAKAYKYLKKNRPDICYIEPPTGPLFFLCDRNLIRKLHWMKIPIGFFYRDLYWKFKGKDFVNIDWGLYSVLKRIVIRAMQYRDLFLLKRCVTKIYFPTKSVNKYMKLREYGVLPPGCIERDIVKIKHDGIQAIYVGGATERYGMGLLLESWYNKKMTNDVRLNIVCPKQQWKDWVQKHPNCNNLPDNIKVYHLCDGEKLQELYAKADFAVIPILKTNYNDMALPIKLYEYISYMLPIVATNCTESAQFIEKNGIGIIVEDNVDSLVMGINKIISDQDGYNLLLENCAKTKAENTWEERVKKVVHDLSGR